MKLAPKAPQMLLETFCWHFLCFVIREKKETCYYFILDLCFYTPINYKNTYSIFGKALSMHKTNKENLALSLKTNQKFWPSTNLKLRYEKTGCIFHVFNPIF